MKNVLLTAFLATAALSVQAQESCAMKVAKLVASGEAKKLAAMFPRDLIVEAPVTSMLGHIGPLSRLEQVEGPRFGGHSRASVSHPSMTKAEPRKFTGNWVNAESDKHGPIQLFIATEPGNGCTLLQLNFDTPMQ